MIDAHRGGREGGDPRLLRRRRRPASAQGGGQVNPDSFTHGSSGQRMEWFNTGRANGEPGDCDTFSPETL